jgi:AbrB family looped-hinge helix DNA binding protein
MRITSKGQVTIPAEFREKAGLLPDTEVEFEMAGEGVKIRRARKPTKESRGRRIVRRLRGLPGDNTLTTDDIMRMTRGEGE